MAWLRWAMLRNTALAPARVRASSAAAATAARWATSTAASISPISSAPRTTPGKAASMSTCSPRRIRPSSSGSRCEAPCVAARIPAMRLPIPLPMRIAASIAMTMSATTPSTTPTTTLSAVLARSTASVAASWAVPNAMSVALAATASPAAESSPATAIARSSATARSPRGPSPVWPAGACARGPAASTSSVSAVNVRHCAESSRAVPASCRAPGSAATAACMAWPIPPVSALTSR